MKINPLLDVAVRADHREELLVAIGLISRTPRFDNNDRIRFGRLTDKGQYEKNNEKSRC